MLLTAIDLEVEKSRPIQFNTAAHALARLNAQAPISDVSGEVFAKALKSVAQLAQTLDALVLKNKSAVTEVRPLAEGLAGVYQTWIALLPPSDPRIAAAHHNLAETLFAIKDFEGAALHYRLVPTDAVRAVAARYETLRSVGLIPQQLTAKKLDAESSPREAQSQLREWILWIDALPDPERKKSEEVANFRFEANRALYAAGGSQKP